MRLPEEIDKVWEKALIDCKNIETLILPATVKSISEEALSWPKHLKALVCNIPIEKLPKSRQESAICGFCQAKMDTSYTFSEKVNQNYRQYMVANLETLFRKRMDHGILLTYMSENMVIAKGYQDCVAFVDETGARVIVKTDSLKAESVAQIKDIVVEKIQLVLHKL